MKLMNQFSVLFFSMMLFVVTAIAQDDYLVHTVKKGETLSVIAKHFHTTTGAIMHLNGMNSKSKLKVGEKVKIPSAAVAAKEEKPEPAAPVVEKKIKTKPVIEPAETKAESETAVTKLHTVGAKETLYSISKKYKVSVADIQKWNHLTKTNIRGGQKLIVGYNYVTAPPKVVAPITNAPVENKTEITPVATTPIASSQQSAVVPVVKKEDRIVSNTNVTGEGFFASSYQSNGKELSGDASTFKTASGWLDKKFYVLINNIPEGTIVRVAGNNKVVYAKVLGPLPDIKEDNGLLVRISNAAAASLGISDVKFAVIVNY